MSESTVREQVGGTHYQELPMEPSTLLYKLMMKGAGISPAASHIIPYVLRYQLKGGVQDLEKARDWINIHEEHMGEAYAAMDEALREAHEKFNMLVLDDMRDCVETPEQFKIIEAVLSEQGDLAVHRIENLIQQYTGSDQEPDAEVVA